MDSGNIRRRLDLPKFTPPVYSSSDHAPTTKIPKQLDYSFSQAQKSPVENIVPKFVFKMSTFTDEQISNWKKKLNAGKHIVINNFIDDSVAGELHHFLMTMPAQWWNFFCHPILNKSTGRNEIRSVAYIGENMRFISEHWDEVERYHSKYPGDIVYRFYRAADHKSTCYCTLCKAFTFLKSKKVMDLMSKLSGDNLTTFDDRFASWYDKGCFLTPHTDVGKGKLAMVYNLSTNWKISYGGCLHLFDLDKSDPGSVSADILVPGFNSLVLFKLPPKGKSHMVSSVNCLPTKGSRLAITGWYN